MHSHLSEMLQLIAQLEKNVKIKTSPMGHFNILVLHQPQLLSFSGKAEEKSPLLEGLNKSQQVSRAFVHIKHNHKEEKSNLGDVVSACSTLP